MSGLTEKNIHDSEQTCKRTVNKPDILPDVTGYAKVTVIRDIGECTVE